MSSATAVRTIRARTGGLSDPVPEGKEVDAGPTHYQTLTEDSHAPAITETEERTQGQAKEDRKAFTKEMQHARNETSSNTGPPGQQAPGRGDSGRQASAGNKLMNQSRQ
ncbi:hypothetical protein WJX72_007253 [[Myrmecia] bisecta]|uniref:Uncharacterized protein n=1 Tax=[Myrmecia] bisecta TaxID=41462 RepID=A0AAW1QFK5_9CHLO